MILETYVAILLVLVDQFLVMTMACSMAGLCNIYNSRMLYSAATLVKENCLEHCRVPSLLVENGTETYSQKCSAF
jgi:hypothetical protein